ncbi:hypothetical protein AABB24_019008, partial [Solanum stoloniferum]
SIFLFSLSPKQYNINSFFPFPTYIPLKMTTTTTTTSLLFLKKLVFFYLIFLACLNNVTSIRELSSTSARIEPSSSTSMVDGTSNVLMKPQRNHNKGPIFHGKEVRDCLPKGFRHASAPSRYVNYHILGSIGCSQGKNIKKLP